ncbi:MAG: hypothetical protein FRX49_02707 [Trebouxia sp. A1-2]|nr:MAG: hypothetical protein FRX49_02707 [Trebouxia sp. A1-2]
MTIVIHTHRRHLEEVAARKSQLAVFHKADSLLLLPGGAGLGIREVPIRVLPPRLAGAPIRVDPKAEGPPDPKRALVAAAATTQDYNTRAIRTPKQGCGLTCAASALLALGCFFWNMASSSTSIGSTPPDTSPDPKAFTRIPLVAGVSGVIIIAIIRMVLKNFGATRVVVSLGLTCRACAVKGW